MDKYLIYTCGYPFSGKSTLARAIAAATGFALVEVDAFMTNTDSWLDAYVAAYAVMRGHLAAGQSVVLDSVAHTRKNRYRLHRIAADYDAIPTCVWLDLPVTEADRRRRLNQTNPTRAHVPDEGFQQIVTGFQPPDTTETVLRFHPTDNVESWIASNCLPFVARETVTP